MHAILAKHGMTNQHSDLFGKSGREFLATLELRDAPRRRLDSLLALINDFDRKIVTSPPRSNSAPKKTTVSTRSPRSVVRAQHSDADHRRDRRHRTLPDSPSPMRLGAGLTPSVRSATGWMTGAIPPNRNAVDKPNPSPTPTLNQRLTQAAPSWMTLGCLPGGERSTG